jgi:hypothetical protein
MEELWSSGRLGSARIFSGAVIATYRPLMRRFTGYAGAGENYG